MHLWRRFLLPFFLALLAGGMAAADIVGPPLASLRPLAQGQYFKPPNSASAPQAENREEGGPGCSARLAGVADGGAPTGPADAASSSAEDGQCAAAHEHAQLGLWLWLCLLAAGIIVALVIAHIVFARRRTRAAHTDTVTPVSPRDRHDSGSGTDTQPAVRERGEHMRTPPGPAGHHVAKRSHTAPPRYNITPCGAGTDACLSGGERQQTARDQIPLQAPAQPPFLSPGLESPYPASDASGTTVEHNDSDIDELTPRVKRKASPGPRLGHDTVTAQQTGEGGQGVRGGWGNCAKKQRFESRSPMSKEAKRLLQFTAPGTLPLVCVHVDRGTCVYSCVCVRESE